MKILIVDDDKDVLLFLKKTLQAEGHAIDTAGDGEKGSFIARTNEYDLIILDYHMPKKNGIEVCQDLRKNNKHTPILILSVHTEVDDKVTLLNAGADDYLTKPHSHRELLARINALVKRPALINLLRYTVNDITIDTHTQEVWIGNKEVYLTRKEFALLELLIKNRGKIVTRGAIMEYVWDMEVDPFSKTIETHILNLRHKLETARKKIIFNVPGRGYRIKV